MNLTTTKGTGPPDGAASRAAIQPYESAHPEYLSAIRKWQKITTILQGSDAVKQKRSDFVPSLNEQSEKDHRSYVERGCFYNATARTHEAMIGLILRKSPEIKSAEISQPLFLGDVDLAGSSISEHIREMLSEISSKGHGGTLIDWSQEEQRAYFCNYSSEDVTNWHHDRIGGRVILTQLTLKEEGYAVNPDTLEHEEVTTYRVFRLIDGKAEITVTKVQNENVFEEDPRFLTRRGKALEFIPFVFNTPKGPKASVPKSPLSDLAEVNISQFQTSCDLENGRHVAGLPTPYALGFDADEELVLGTTHAWVSDNHEARIGYLEFTGAGLTELREAMKEKTEQMASLGAKMLETRTGDAEAYGTVKLRADSEFATLIEIASSASASLTLALQIVAWWEGTKEKPSDYQETSIVLNTDFVGTKMSGPELTSLISAYQLGVISWDVLFYNLQQGEIYPNEWTIEEEKSAIEQGGLSLSLTNPPAEEQDLDE